MEIITPGAFAHHFEKLAAILGAGGPPDQVKLAELHSKHRQTLNMEWVPALMAKYGLTKLVGGK